MQSWFYTAFQFTLLCGDFSSPFYTGCKECIMKAFVLNPQDW